MSVPRAARRFDVLFHFPGAVMARLQPLQRILDLDMQPGEVRGHEVTLSLHADRPVR
jgi:hypothetical protein